MTEGERGQRPTQERQEQFRKHVSTVGEVVGKWPEWKQEAVDWRVPESSQHEGEQDSYS